jgi:hypothetical protein
MAQIRVCRSWRSSSSPLSLFALLPFAHEILLVFFPARLLVVVLCGGWCSISVAHGVPWTEVLN